ncbi:hypothetical protein QG516_25895 [Pedobacter gandavensis]|uniref:hypothetical protein n=1 Tax=Pedobacter gandavensis TaxID=2679963 RepID=UPI00247A6A48|nr:hypothetical protein [Pedobacter gandavensis]WGQ09948.1 hypothetical protein QG516_25895 [Pedobacter gandavensis]
MRAQFFFFLCLSFLLTSSVLAQEIKGTVADRDTRELQEYVEIFNISNHQKTISNKKGEFKIPAMPNDVLVFMQPGYRIDTLFLVNLKPVRRYLQQNKYDLQTIEIKGTAFNPEQEYADAYRAAKAFVFNVNCPLSFSPLTYFSKKGRYARKFVRRMKKEPNERAIDQRFNNFSVKAICPLEGAELDGFMVMYRPTFKALEKMGHDELKLYIMDAYKEFKQLPEAQKKLPSLKYR